MTDKKTDFDNCQDKQGDTATRVVIMTGGNGDKVESDIVTVVGDIERLLGRVVMRSEVMSSPPFGFEAERDFLNQALVVETSLSPETFLERIWQIERSYGRQRGSRSEEIAKWQARCEGRVGYSSRNMDIDILFWGDEIISTETLAIPHPELHKRRFVLEPLCMIVPDMRHPVLNITVGELARKLSEERA